MTVSSVLMDDEATQAPGSTGVVMPRASELDRAVTLRLADHGLRYTDGRRRLVAALRYAAGPITLPALLRLAKNVAQSSAYRNLTVLEEAGVARRLLRGGAQAHYELAEGLTVHHHHMICDICGAVSDFTLPSALEHSLDHAFESVAAGVGFAVSNHVIDMHGRCARCAA